MYKCISTNMEAKALVNEDIPTLKYNILYSLIKKRLKMIHSLLSSDCL